MKTYLKNFSLFFLTIVLMLGLVELVLQLIPYPATPVYGWAWDQSPYRGPINQNDQQINQLGLRGKKIEYTKDDFVVLLVGDSQTEAGTQSADHLPEAILEQALKKQIGSDKVKVFSIASAGWGQDQQLVYLEKYFQAYRADLVLNWFTPVNDYWENTFIDRSVTQEAGRLKPTYLLQDDRLMMIMPRDFEWKLRNLISLALDKSPKNEKISLEQVYLNQWLSQLPSNNRTLTNSIQCPSAQVLETELIESYRNGSRAYTLLVNEDVENGRSHFSPFLQNLSDRDHYSIAVTHKLMEEMRDLTHKQGAEFYIFHAYRNDLDAAFREIKCVRTQQNGLYYQYNGEDWLRHLKQSTLRDYLIKFEVNSEQALNVARGDWHLSHAGNEQVLKELAANIKDQYIRKHYKH